MTEAIIIALIAAAGSVIGQAFISAAARKRDAIERAVLDERTNNRLDVIEKKLDIHNGYAERFGDIQVDLAAIRGELEILKGRKEI